MNLGLKPPEELLIDQISVLAREKFAPRADHYDRSAVFPLEDFEDLFGAGLLAPVVPKEYGGLGIGPLNGSAFTLWMMTKELAKADLSLARCWEGHTNSLVLLAGLGNPEQQRRWFDGVVGTGERWAAWSGEPRSPKPGEKMSFGTQVEPVKGGYRVSGSKVFSTSAVGAQWAILLVNTDSTGGARHGNAHDKLLLLACDLSDASVTTDPSWWDPLGMRGTVSHLVKFDSTFIPIEQQIGVPGAYFTGGWQSLFTPHYAASFVGAAEACYNYSLEYLKHSQKVEDPYVQHRVARMSINLETSHLWLRRVADLWSSGRKQEARIAGSRTRYLVEHLAEETLREAVRACGARSLVRPSPIERIYRDLSFYLRHDNDDHILATIGRALLGQPHDLSFHRI